jgi:hypothetical protein
LNGQRKRARIIKVDIDDLREKDGATKRKYVVHFEGEERGLPLNKTNALRLAQAFGKDRTKWVGRPVELYSEMTSLGKEGVRLRPLQPKQTPPAQPDPDLDDAIPY